MSDKSAIQWTDATWNPVTGCTKVSPGCAHCYIERTPAFRIAGRKFVKGSTGVILHPDRLDQPLRWKRPRMVFVNSLSDLFHEAVPDPFIDRIFAMMALAPRHTFQILTKRPERLRAYLQAPERAGLIALQTCADKFPNDQQNLSAIADTVLWGGDPAGRIVPVNLKLWPLPNVWLGVTTESQRFADERIPLLLDTPAAVRFISAEPLLGPLDLTKWLTPSFTAHPQNNINLRVTIGPMTEVARTVAKDVLGWAGLDWVIAGGESAGPPERLLVTPCCRKGSPFGPPQRKPGTGFNPRETVCEWANWGQCEIGNNYAPRPERVGWVRDLRDQCVSAGVPFFFKQWGGPRPKSGGRCLDGREWNEMPEVGGGG